MPPNLSCLGRTEPSLLHEKVEDVPGWAGLACWAPGAVLGAGNTCFLSVRASLLQLSHVQVLLVGSVAPLSGGEGCPSY